VKTDSLFYRLFQQQPEIFFELLPDSPAEAAAYEFASVEVVEAVREPPLLFGWMGYFSPSKRIPGNLSMWWKSSSKLMRNYTIGCLQNYFCICANTSHRIRGGWWLFIPVAV
jgi:hypothetical protein